MPTCTLRFTTNGVVTELNGGGGGGGFKDFEKLLNEGIKINGGVATNYKREETNLGLSLNTVESL